MNHLVTSWPIQCRTRTVSTKYNSENKGILLVHAYETWIYKLHKNRQSFDEKSNNRATMRCSTFVSRSGFGIWPKIVHCPKRWVIANFWKIVAEGRETVDPTMHKMLGYNYNIETMMDFWVIYIVCDISETFVYWRGAYLEFYLVYRPLFIRYIRKAIYPLNSNRFHPKVSPSIF